jgi:hypothetical protein
MHCTKKYYVIREMSVWDTRVRTEGREGVAGSGVGLGENIKWPGYKSHTALRPRRRHSSLYLNFLKDPFETSPSNTF